MSKRVRERGFGPSPGLVIFNFNFPTTMNGTVFLWLGSLAVLLTITSCAGPLGRGKYETPSYNAVLSDGAFEVRDYPTLVVATAPMGAGRQNGAFMKLFRYISGDNVKEQKIAMTTPVFGTMKGEARDMSFVVPEEIVKAGVPESSNPDVKISKRQAGRFAVYRYSGRWTEAREVDAQTKLAAWMKSKGLTVEGGFEKANYDPPFTPPSMRRNEVLVRIKK